MQSNKNMIYSPEEKIPLGEPVILPNGAHGLRIKWKRGKKDVTETVPLDKIHELIVQEAAKANSRVPND